MNKLLLILVYLPLICLVQKTYVLDDNFKQNLILLVYDDIFDDSELTTNINTETS